MVKRYTINRLKTVTNWRLFLNKKLQFASVYGIANFLENCLVTPSVYEGVLQRFDEFITPFMTHLITHSQQKKCKKQ